MYKITVCCIYTLFSPLACIILFCHNSRKHILITQVRLNIQASKIVESDHTNGLFYNQHTQKRKSSVPKTIEFIIPPDFKLFPCLYTNNTLFFLSHAKIPANGFVSLFAGICFSIVPLSVEFCLKISLYQSMLAVVLIVCHALLYRLNKSHLHLD